MNTPFKEKNLLNMQMFLSVLFIITIIVSISLTYDEKQKWDNKDGLYTNNQIKSISITNKIIVLVIVIFYLYINIENINIDKMKNKKNNLLYTQLLVSIITIIAASLSLYIVIKNNDISNVIDIENPTT